MVPLSASLCSARGDRACQDSRDALQRLLLGSATRSTCHVFGSYWTSQLLQILPRQRRFLASWPGLDKHQETATGYGGSREVGSGLTSFPGCSPAFDNAEPHQQQQQQQQQRQQQQQGTKHNDVAFATTWQCQMTQSQ